MLNLQIRLLLIALRTWSLIAGRAPGDAVPDATRSSRYAPVVGLVVAVPASLAYALAGLWLPHRVALLAGLAAAARLTGAMHERDFAALCDHGRASPVADAIGVAGAMGLLVLLLARIEILSALDPSWIAVILLCGAALSRGFAVLVTSGSGAASFAAASAATANPATANSATASPAADGSAETPGGILPGGTTGTQSTAARGGAPGTTEKIVASACALAPLVAAIAWTGDAGVFFTGLAGAAAAALFARQALGRRGGVSRATRFGTVQQIAELGFQAGILAALAFLDETPAD